MGLGFHGFQVSIAGTKRSQDEDLIPPTPNQALNGAQRKEFMQRSNKTLSEAEAVPRLVGFP